MQRKERVIFATLLLAVLIINTVFYFVFGYGIVNFMMIVINLCLVFILFIRLLTARQVCPACGAELIFDQRFCDRCGSNQ